MMKHTYVDYTSMDQPTKTKYSVVHIYFTEQSSRGNHRQLLISQAEGEFNDNVVLPDLLLSEYTFNSKDFTALYSLLITLRDEKIIYKRQVYTLLNMIGDIGGLADGLFFLLGFFLHFYNEIIWQSELVKSLFLVQD